MQSRTIIAELTNWASYISDLLQLDICIFSQTVLTIYCDTLDRSYANWTSISPFYPTEDAIKMIQMIAV